MLDKIIVSADRKSARVYFDTHSIGFYHSSGLVIELIYEIVIEPSVKLEAHWKEKEEKFLASLEKTQEIDLQLSFKDVA